MVHLIKTLVQAEPGQNLTNEDYLAVHARLHMKKSAYDDKLFSYVHNESFTLIDQGFVTEHLPGKFTRLEVYNDHVFRHQSIKEGTEQEQQWKSMVTDHGIIVLELTRMLKP